MSSASPYEGQFSIAKLRAPPMPVVLELFYISYPLSSNKITRFTPKTLNGAHFLKLRNLV